MDTWIGTSGFSYRDWIGTVYPKGLREIEWFDFYIRTFNSLELNMSYYTVPSSKLLSSLSKRAPEGFLFTLKAHKSITHELNFDFIPAYINAVRFFENEKKQAIILLQFPYSFKFSESNFNMLKKICNFFSEKAAVEFRNISWLKEEIFEWSLHNKVILVSVDEPDLPNLLPKTVFPSETIYLRFHGRNSEKWWNHQNTYERYNYLYSKEEMLSWIEKIKAFGKRNLIVYFNNHYSGSSFVNAMEFSNLLH